MHISDMKNMITRIEMLKNLTAAFLFTFALPVLGQQMNFSQFQLTPLLNNPSLIAVSDEIKADFGYRNQFGGKQGNYSTPFLAGQMPLFVKTDKEQFRKFGAAGVQLLTDRTGYNGMLATTGFSVAYTHIATLSRTDKLAFGLQPGIYQRRVDFSRITTGSQWDGYNGVYDPSRSLNENIAATERATFFTMNAGITYIRENLNGEPFFTISLGGNNLTRPNISLNAKTFNNPVNWNLQASVMAFEDEQFQIKPTFRHVQVRNLNQTNIGSYFYYKLKETNGLVKAGNIGLGLWYSNQNALVTALEINQKDWALGFSYDFLTSALADASNRTGAPEIIIGFRKYIGKRKKGSDISAGGGGGGGGSDKPSKMDDPKKSNPTKAEMTPEPVAKPTQPIPKNVDSTSKPAAPAIKPVVPAKPENPVVDTKPKTEKPAVTTKPAIKKSTRKAPAKKAAGTTNKKKPTPARKPQSKNRLQSNLSPDMERKLADVVTPDEYLGNDPYKGTQKALNSEQRSLMKKQPRYGLGGFEIDQNTAEQLDKIAEMMKSRPKMKLEIGGYGCDIGGAEVTKLTSLGRAESVKRYLASKGVSEDQLQTKAYGLVNPIRNNGEEDGKAANRRVQFKFLP